MKPAFIFLLIAVALLIASACSNKKKQPKEKFVPVLSFIQSQIAHVDTSLYSIRKIIYIDSLTNDTTYIPREKFRNEAHDFLTIPDISSPEYADRFTEDKNYDETINRVWITYIPVDPAKEQIQRQEVLIKPDDSGGEIASIIINSVINTKDSLVEKRMLWQVDQSFQVTVTRQLVGQPEKTSTYKVIWGEDEY